MSDMTTPDVLQSSSWTACAKVARQRAQPPWEPLHGILHGMNVGWALDDERGVLYLRFLGKRW